MKPGDLIRYPEDDKYGYVLSVEKDFYGTNTAGVYQDRLYIRWFKGHPDFNTSYEPEACLEVVSEH